MAAKSVKSKSKVKAKAKAKPKAKVVKVEVEQTQTPAKPTVQKVEASLLGGEIKSFATPISLGDLKKKMQAEHLQAVVDGEPEDNDSFVIQSASFVTFSEKVKGNKENQV